MNDAVISLIGTLFAGVGFKLVEHILLRTKRRDDTATMLRSELRAEVEASRRENKQLRDEVEEKDREIDGWRNKYYSLVASIAAGDLEGARRKIIEGK